MDVVPMMSVMGLVVLVLAAVVVAFGIFGGLTRRAGTPVHQHVRRSRGLPVALSVACAIGLLLMVKLTVAPSRHQQSPTVVYEQAQNGTIEEATRTPGQQQSVHPALVPGNVSPLPTEAEDRSSETQGSVPEDRSSETQGGVPEDPSAETQVAGDAAIDGLPAEGSDDKLPAWTQKSKVVLAQGEVDVVLLVTKSALFATEEEARSEATSAAKTVLQSRMVEDYPQLDRWQMPAAVFAGHSQKRTHTQVKMHDFGQFREPMYQVWVQYEDSAAVREPMIDFWESTRAGDLATRYVAGMGFLALCLGTFSAGMRVFLAAPGTRAKSVATAVALAGGTAATAVLFLA